MDVLLVEAGAQAVTTAGVKSELRIEGDTSQDSYIASLIVARERWAERFCGVALLASNWKAVYDRDDLEAYLAVDESSGGYLLRIPMRPVRAVTSIKFYDTAHQATPLAASDWTLVTEGTQACLYINSGVLLSSWRQTACIVVEFSAGWQALANIPAAIVSGITMAAADDFENPEATQDLPACPRAERLLALEKPARVG